MGGRKRRTRRKMGRRKRKPERKRVKRKRRARRKMKAERKRVGRKRRARRKGKPERKRGRRKRAMKRSCPYFSSNCSRKLSQFVRGSTAITSSLSLCGKLFVRHVL